MNNKLDIAVIIPIKNEEMNLSLSLPSVAWAKEIWVVDSKSSDRSEEISLKHGAKFVQFEFNGTWPKKKGWALKNLPIKTAWVFLLDADEVLPEGIETELEMIIKNKNSFDGYWINRKFMFMGDWLKHAYYPNWNLRLFRSGLGSFEKIVDIDTQSGDNEVHEHVIVNGNTGRLRSEMLHYAFPDVNVFMEKHNRYSNWEARVAIEGTFGGSEKSIASRHVRFRRFLKRVSLKLPFRSLLRFLYVYIGQLGILDGRRGYYFARLHAIYEELCVIKTRELEITRRK